MTGERDQWHRWLLEVRHGGDAGYREQVLQELYPVRDQVLDRSSLRPDDVLLDVGTGDGLIGFGALDRLGPAGRVIFSDISQDLLDHCRSAAIANGQLSRCDFVLASADQLAGVPDASVDVVATRSVLIYVPDKAAAFAEFRRVLRPGGRLSIFGPNNTLMQGCGSTAFFGYDLSPIPEIAAKESAAFPAIQPRGADPMLDFEDRDLVRLAERAGFGTVSLDLRVNVKSSRDPVPWGPVPAHVRQSEAAARGRDGGRDAQREAAEFAAHLRPLVEEGHGDQRIAVAYLAAS